MTSQTLKKNNKLYLPIPCKELAKKNTTPFSSVAIEDQGSGGGGGGGTRAMLLKQVYPVHKKEYPITHYVYKS